MNDTRGPGDRHTGVSHNLRASNPHRKACTHAPHLLFGRQLSCYIVPEVVGTVRAYGNSGGGPAAQRYIQLLASPARITPSEPFEGATRTMFGCSSSSSSVQVDRKRLGWCSMRETVRESYQQRCFPPGELASLVG